MLFAPPDSGKSLDIGNYRFTIPVQLRGRTFQFVADHGASATLITDSTIVAAGLPGRFAHATRADTLVKHGGVKPVADTSASVVITRGDSTFEYWGDIDPWIIDSIRVAGSLQEKIFIASEPPAASLQPAGGLLGRDILSQFDLELDVPHRAFRLYPRSAVASPNPAWLPSGMTAADCLRAQVVQHMGIDTVGMDSSDMAETRFYPFKRIWDDQELLLPLDINGHSIAGHFDSGSDETIMNWTAARTLGLDPKSPRVSRVSSGTLVLFSFHPTALAGVLDTTNYLATGVTLRIGDHTLPADTVAVSDATFSDFADFQTKPLILVGLRHFRDNVLFLSYSTGQVCVGRPVK